MKERREYVRCDGLVLVDYKGEEIEGKSSAFDVGGAGVRLTIDQEPKVGLPVELRIYLPGDSQSIKAEGEVVWTEKCKEQPPTPIEPKKEYFYAGIKFTDIDENSRKKIASYVSRRLH